MARQHVSGSGIGRYAGVDQGVDFTSKGLIPALANAIVTDVGNETDVEGQHGKYVIYKILGGPKAGQYVYNAETLTPTVHVGQHLKAGQSIGVNQGILPGGAGTGIEIGFNSAPTGWRPVGALGGATPQGQDMWNFIQAAEKGTPYVAGPLVDTSNVTYPNGSGGGGKASRSAGGGGDLQAQIMALANSILANNANRPQTPAPRIDPLVVNPALASPIFNSLLGGASLGRIAHSPSGQISQPAKLY